MADVNAPSGQTLIMTPPVRDDDQILPHIRWVPIGKSNCYLDLEKSQSNPIYKIAVDLLKNTNFFRGFTASSTIPLIYIQQFWDTILYDKKAGCYKCQLDKQWFDLTKETLGEALQITPVNHNQAFAAPPSIDGLIDFVNQLGYLKLVMNLSNVVTNDLFQLWRAILTIINLCLTGKTSGFERPRAHHTLGKKRATLIVISSIWFTKMIIYHLQRKHRFHLRPDSPLHLSNEEPILGYLKFSAKGYILSGNLAKVTHHRKYLAGEIGGVQNPPAPKPTQPARKPKAPTRPSILIPVASTQPAPTSAPAKSQENKQAEEVPAEESQVADEDAVYQKAVEESMKDANALPKGPLPPVVIREPESGKYQPLPEVPRKGKAKVIKEQSDNEEESKKVILEAEEGGQDEDQAGPDPVAQAEDQTSLDASAQADGQARSNPDETSEGQAGSNPNETSKGQAEPDPSDVEAKVQSILSHVVHAGSDREHMDLDVVNVSPQPSTEQLDEGFTATVYPNVQENLKLAVEEPVLLEEPASSSGTLSSLQHLSRDFSFGDQFFSDKLSDANKNAKTKVESMVNVTIQQALSSISLMTLPIIDLTSRLESPKEHQQLKATTTDITTTITTTTTLPPPQAPQQSTTEAIMVKRIEADMKEILHQRMWESDSYKSHEDHMQLFEALEKSMNRDHSEELTQDLAKARKKKKKGRESPKTPPGSPPHQPPPPPRPAGPSGDLGAPRACGSAQMPPSPPPTSSTNQESPSKGSAAPNLEIDKDMAPDEQAQSSDDEDIGSAHIPTVNIRQGWWKPFEEERLTTPKPAWSIRSSDVPVPMNNWASALVSNYSPPPEDSLLAQTGDIATFIDWFYKRRGITKLKPQDLEGPAYEIVKVFHPDQTTTTGGPPGQVTIQSDFFFNKDLEYLRYGSKGRRPALSISKMKAAYYPNAGLEKMVPDQFWIEEECEYDIAAIRIHMQILSVIRIEVFSMYGYDYMKKIVLRHVDLNEHVIAERDFEYLYPNDFEDLYLLNLQGHLNHLPPKDKKILTTDVNQWTIQLVIRQRVEDFQLGIKSHQTQMMMRFNEIHKFNDGTLLQINKALDYRVKEFKINRLNPEAFEDTEDLSQPGELCWRTRQRGRLQTFEAYRLINLFRHSRPLSDDL
nr:hypothetical protein [Tanacetum cinerariifolium]GEX25074.1 hypothetical protein [Tanacetum cinerariifolium]